MLCELEGEQHLHPVLLAETGGSHRSGERAVHERPGGISPRVQPEQVPVVRFLGQVAAQPILERLFQGRGEVLARLLGGAQTKFAACDGAHDPIHCVTPNLGHGPDGRGRRAVLGVVPHHHEVRAELRVLEIFAAPQVSHEERVLRPHHSHLQAVFGLELVGAHPVVVAAPVVLRVQLLLEEALEERLHEPVGKLGTTLQMHETGHVPQVEELDFALRVEPQLIHVLHGPLAVLLLGRDNVLLPEQEHLARIRADLQPFRQVPGGHGLRVVQAAIAGQHVEHVEHGHAESPVQIGGARVQLAHGLQERVHVEHVLVPLDVAQVDRVQDGLDLEPCLQAERAGGQTGGRRAFRTSGGGVLVELFPADPDEERHLRHPSALLRRVHEVDERARAQARAAHEAPDREPLVQVRGGVGGHREAGVVTLIAHHCLRNNRLDERIIIAYFGQKIKLFKQKQAFLLKI